MAYENLVFVKYSEETANTCECGKKIGEDGYCERCDYEGK